jgi:hypothetical protein
MAVLARGEGPCGFSFARKTIGNPFSVQGSPVFKLKGAAIKSRAIEKESIANADFFNNCLRCIKPVLVGLNLANFP